MRAARWGTDLSVPHRPTPLWVRGSVIYLSCFCLGGVDECDGWVVWALLRAMPSGTSPAPTPVDQPVTSEVELVETEGNMRILPCIAILPSHDDITLSHRRDNDPFIKILLASSVNIVSC